MDVRGDGFEHEHDLVAAEDDKVVVVCVFVAATLVKNVEAQLGLKNAIVTLRSSTIKKGATLFSMAGGLWTRI